MGLCTFCKNINIEDLAVTFPVDFKKWDEPPGYVHQPDLPSLVKSATECDLCRLMLDAVERDGSIPEFKTVSGATPDQIGQKSASQRIKLRAFRPTSATVPPVGLGLSSISISNAQRLNGYIDIVAMEGSQAAMSGDIDGRPIESLISTNSFDRISLWADTCCRQHKKCAFQPFQQSDPNTSQGDPVLPTRVLAIGSYSSDKIYLVLGNGEKGKYATLSHRWGREEDMPTTTTDDLASRMIEIRPDELSQKFRDAITVTRRLGIKFLWIDSLCILQGNREDWEREAAAMCDVYGRSDITISAAVGDDMTGFLGPRNTHMVKGNCLRNKESAVEGDLFFRRSRNQLDRDIREAPLNQRAWVLQERILAPRLLTFTSSQIYWECREIAAGEGGPQASRIEHSDRFLISRLIRLKADSGNTSLRAEPYSGWRDHVVAVASEAELTYETDRLYALLGLARFMYKVTGSEYAYGVWMDDLPQQLMWRVQARNASLFTCKRPRRHRAPSWSWASLEGPVSFLVSDMENKTICFERTTRPKPVLLSPLPVRDDELHLSAHICPCYVMIEGTFWGSGIEPMAVNKDDKSWVRATKTAGLAIRSVEGSVIGGAFFDLQPTKTTLGWYTSLLLLEGLATYQPDCRRYATGLLLQKLEGADVFVRMGRISFSARGSDWLKSFPKQLVTLI